MNNTLVESRIGMIQLGKIRHLLVFEKIEGLPAKKKSRQRAEGEQFKKRKASSTGASYRLKQIPFKKSLKETEQDVNSSKKSRFPLLKGGLDEGRDKKK